MAVKDPARFPGGWAYFDFGAAAPAPRPGDRRPSGARAVMRDHAARDNVFVQFYPQLRER